MLINDNDNFFFLENKSQSKTKEIKNTATH